MGESTTAGCAFHGNAYPEDLGALNYCPGESLGPLVGGSGSTHDPHLLNRQNLNNCSRHGPIPNIILTGILGPTLGCACMRSAMLALVGSTRGQSGGKRGSCPCPCPTHTLSHHFTPARWLPLGLALSHPSASPQTHNTPGPLTCSLKWLCSPGRAVLYFTAVCRNRFFRSTWDAIIKSVDYVIRNPTQCTRIYFERFF